MSSRWSWQSGHAHLDRSKPAVVAKFDEPRMTILALTRRQAFTLGVLAGMAFCWLLMALCGDALWWVVAHL